MATAKKLPSGAYRVRVYSHTDGQGKKHYESFTADTKKGAELAALEWKNKKDRHERTNMTVHEAIEGYINAKTGVLSPSTIRAYRVQLRNNYQSIENIPIQKLNNEKLQVFVSELSGKVTPKSVSNIYGLLSSTLRFYMPDAYFHVTLPKRAKMRKSAPSDGDIQTLFRLASPEMKKCIALGAFGALRRGEIYALTYGDIEGNIIHVTKDMIQDSDNNWILKDIPKTSESWRDAPVPNKVVELLGTGKPDQRIINYSSPNCITVIFTELRDKLNLNICFHDLRHYYASIGAILIPDIYLSDFGGWRRGSSVMKEVYQNNIVPMSELYAEKMKKHFEGLL